MDSQTIGSVNGATGSSQSQAYVPAGGSKGSPASEVVVKEPPKTQIDVRMRDPRSLQYQVDGSTKQVVATIVDESNQMVVVQIPDEEMLRIAKAIDRMKGFLLEGKA